jgi:hypothetical protein
VPPQEAKITAEIIALQLFPGGWLLPLILMPAMELEYRLTVIALRVSRCAAIGGQVLKEFLDPWVADFGFVRLRFHGSPVAALSLGLRGEAGMTPAGGHAHFVASAVSPSRGGNSNVTFPISSITR